MINNNSSVYTVKEVMEKLNISKNPAYDLFKSGQFPVIKIGDTYRVSKEVFNRWINGKMD